jgi:methyl-accepting chemotaxis protein
MTVTDRVMDALRDTLRGAKDAARSARGALDEALLFTSHEQASKAAATAMSVAQAAGATAAQQRSSLDAAADHSRLLASRGRDVRAAASQVREALERAKLVALNAGLEGARLGEPIGKALVAVADELRSAIGRALEALEEHLTLVGQVERDREKLRDQVENARQSAASLAEELLRVQASQREATAALGELGQGLKRTTGTDPEVARTLAAASEHARGLIDALNVLASRPQRNLALRALRPTIRPLLRLMRELDKSGDGDER